MKKFNSLIILAIFALVAMMFVSCSAEVAKAADELVYASFDDAAKALSYSYDLPTYSGLYWQYSAYKTDNYGASGATWNGAENEAFVPVTKDANNEPLTGYEGKVGPFSQGSWHFKLQGYADSSFTKLIYEGEANAKLKKNQTNYIAVTIHDASLTGAIVFDNAYFEWEDADSASGNVVLFIDMVGTNEGHHYIYTETLYQSATDYKYYFVSATNHIMRPLEILEEPAEPEQVNEVAADLYTITVAVRSAEDDELIFAGQQLTMQVYGGISNIITGDIIEGLSEENYFAEPVHERELATVTFYANDGTDGSVQQTIRKETATSLTACGFTREGYIFTGWAVNADGTGTAYTDSQSVTLTQDLTLYAQWESEIPPLSLNGVFSVAANKQVRFSEGNLYYDGSNWGFEENQYDFRTWQGKDSVKDGVYSSTGTASGNTGLYFWSKDAAKACAEQYNDSGKSTADTFFANSSDVMGEEWFALSYDEWDYLINTRLNASDKKGLATINTGSSSVTGLVLLPDSWTLPEGCSWMAGYDNGITTNSYTAEQWAAMEASGAVFLPASGTKDSTSWGVSFINSNGLYWSSTPDSGNASYARYLLFDSGQVSTNYNYHRNNGKSIRLVTLAQ